MAANSISSNYQMMIDGGTNNVIMGNGDVDDSSGNKLQITGGTHTDTLTVGTQPNVGVINYIGGTGLLQSVIDSTDNLGQTYFTSRVTDGVHTPQLAQNTFGGGYSYLGNYGGTDVPYASLTDMISATADGYGAPLMIGTYYAGTISFGANLGSGGIDLRIDGTTKNVLIGNNPTDDSSGAKLQVTGGLITDNLATKAGGTIGFYGAMPTAQDTGWSACTGYTPTKTLDTSTATVGDLLNYECTLGESVRTTGLVGA
jgi:hypothetical protein